MIHGLNEIISTKIIPLNNLKRKAKMGRKKYPIDTKIFIYIS